MSDEDLSVPGFFGKIPAAGDFVSRRLPFDLMQRLDVWLTRHLAPLVGGLAWPRDRPLRFLAGPQGLGPVAGVILPSADKVGRRFPLAMVAVLPAAPIALAYAEHWFSALETAGLRASQGELTADELETRLAELPPPDAPADGDVVETMVIWTESSDLYDVDPDDPREVLDAILAVSPETGQSSECEVTPVIDPTRAPSN